MLKEQLAILTELMDYAEQCENVYLLNKLKKLCN